MSFDFLWWIGFVNHGIQEESETFGLGYSRLFLVIFILAKSYHVLNWCKIAELSSWKVFITYTEKKIPFYETFFNAKKVSRFATNSKPFFSFV